MSFHNSSDLKLICGNRNYSSWSLRAWLTLRKAGIDPELVVLPMDTPEFEERIAEYSPTRRVPVLWMGDEYVWDSLAIAETVNERYADAALWPADPKLRALGRAMAAEMHSSFAALRQELPMNCRARQRSVSVTEGVHRDVTRVSELWEAAKRQSGGSRWLLGDFSIADAMFAPVAVRFNGYALELPSSTRDYVSHWLEDADLKAWMSSAEQETWTIEHEEVGD